MKTKIKQRTRPNTALETAESWMEFQDFPVAVLFTPDRAGTGKDEVMNAILSAKRHTLWSGCMQGAIDQVVEVAGTGGIVEIESVEKCQKLHRGKSGQASFSCDYSLAVALVLIVRPR